MSSEVSVSRTSPSFVVPMPVTWEYYTGPGSALSSRRIKPNDGRPKPHICGICDRAFDRPSALLQHGYTHSGERPHLCQVCKQKRFATSSNLFRHSRSCRGPRSEFIPVQYPGESYLTGLDWRLVNSSDAGSRGYTPRDIRQDNAGPSSTTSSMSDSADVDHRRNHPYNPNGNSSSLNQSSSPLSSSSFEQQHDPPTMFTPFQQIEPFDALAADADDEDEHSRSPGATGEQSRAPPLFSAKRPRPVSPSIGIGSLGDVRRPSSPGRSSQSTLVEPSASDTNSRRDRSHLHDDLALDRTSEPAGLTSYRSNAIGSSHSDGRRSFVDGTSAATHGSNRHLPASAQYWSAQPLIAHSSHSVIPAEYQTIFTVKSEPFPDPFKSGSPRPPPSHHNIAAPQPQSSSSRPPLHPHALTSTISSKGLKWADEAKKTRRTAPSLQASSMVP